MANGIKLDEAMHPKRGRVLVRDLRKGEAGIDDLKCTGCKAKISYVSEHSRANGFVHAFLRLKPKERHVEDCPNLVRNQIEKIVATSREAVGDEIFGSEDGSRVFRLHVVTQKYFDAVRAARAGKEQTIASARVEYLAAPGRNLDPYIRTAAALAILYARIENDDSTELRQSVSIALRGKTIRWSQFVFDESTYEQLVDRLMRDAVTYPVAVVINAQTVERELGKQRFTSRSVNTPAGRISVTAFLEDDGSIMNELAITEGVPYIVVAKPRLTERHGRFFVALQVFFAGQIAQILRTSPHVEPDDQ
jgi:hypothetical protein